MKKLQSWFKDTRSKMSQVKMSSLLDKEGFYIVLFLCLCVVVTTAVWAVRNYNTGLLNRQGDDMVEYDKDNILNNDNLFSWDFEEDSQPITDDKDKDKDQDTDNQGEDQGQGNDAEEPEGEPVPTSTKPISMVAPVFSNKVSLGFGENQYFAGFYQDHPGLDIEAQAGDEVKAALKGKVLKVYYLEDNDNPYDGYGNVVVLGHDNGLTTVYGNLHENIPVVENEEVEAGQVIATVGQSAWLKAELSSHLHFRVMKDDKVQDPKTFLSNIR